MKARRASAATVAALVLVAGIAGCGTSGRHMPDLGQLPLISGAHIVAQVNQCDPGASAYCAINLVVVDPAYRTADEFLLAERHALHKRGWTGANGDTGEESAADSPGHKLHLTYATASGDLDGYDLGWIKRPRPIVLALSRSVFDRTPAVSMLLERGTE